MSTAIDTMLIHKCGFKIRQSKMAEIVNSKVISEIDLSQEERENEKPF